MTPCQYLCGKKERAVFVIVSDNAVNFENPMTQILGKNLT